MSLKVSCCPVLDRFHCCCCKCNLKNATVTLGWIEMVLSSIQLAWFSLCLVEFEDIRHLCWFGSGHLFLFAKGYHVWIDSVDIYIALISQAAILQICCMLLLCGAHSKKPGFMIPYLIICHIGIWLLVLITAVNGFSELFIHFSTGLGIIIGGSTLIVIASYLWLVKYSYYWKLVEKQCQSKAQQGGCPENPAIEQETLT